jgi:signal transduction histidine kinase
MSAPRRTEADPADTVGFVQFPLSGKSADPGEERFAFLARASEALASSLDYEATLATVARLAVPVLADWCTVDVRDDDGMIARIAIAHRDPRGEELARELYQRFPFQLSSAPLAQQRLRQGEPVLVPAVDASMIARVAQSPEHLALLTEMGPCSLMVVPLVARGRVLGAITLLSSDSGRHYAEADLTLAQDLARRAAMAVDNARLYEEAQAAIRTRDEFLSLVSHDLRSPITSIKGLAQLLERRANRLGDPARAQLADGLARIDATTTKMTSLIEELLDLARLQAGYTLELDRQRTELVALARGVVEAQQHNTRRHTIRLESAEPAIVAVLDAARLERVLANLIGNAGKFSPAGGPIVVVLYREPGDGGEEDVGWAVLAVRDEGVGIPAADMPRLFERFHRGRNVAGRIKGTGIGLAGAKQIVEQHGGSITVESHEGAGTTVTLRLPLAGE